MTGVRDGRAVAAQIADADQATRRLLAGAGLATEDRPPAPSGPDTLYWADPGYMAALDAEIDAATSPADVKPTRPPNGRRVASRNLAGVRAERVAWLWPGYLPAGKLVVFDGDPGVGKSTLAMDLAARVSTGRAWPDGQPNPVSAAAVVVMSAEDGLADTVKPRLEAAGGDPGLVECVTGILTVDADTGEATTQWPNLTTDLPMIGGLIAGTGARLLIVDVLMAYLDGRTDSYKDQHVRAVLGPVAAMAERTGCAVIVLRHLTKSQTQAMYRGGGSIGIIGAARAGFVIGRDKEDSARRLFACQKSNLGPEPATLAYRLVSDDAHGCAAVQWEPDPVNGVSADDVLSADSDDGDAARFVRDYLADAGGQAEAGDVIKAGRQAGFTDDAIKSARKRAKITTRKVGLVGQPGGYWAWSLEPDPAAPKVSNCPEGVEGVHAYTFDTFGRS